MFKRLLILCIILLTLLGYIYLPDYNFPVTIIIDTVRVDSSALYLSIASLLSFLVLHWTLNIIKWLRKVPTKWQKYRHLQRLEKHQKLRDSALLAYIEQRYEQAESQFKQCYYYQNELQADNIFAAKMALLQKDYQRAEKYLENQHQNSLAHLLTYCDIHAAQHEFALVADSLKQYHRHHKPTNQTQALLLEAYKHTECWDEMKEICHKLPADQQTKWLAQIHEYNMTQQLLNQLPKDCLTYFKKCQHQEKQDPTLQIYPIVAHIMLDDLPQALKLIKITDDLPQQPVFSIVQVLAQFPFTHQHLLTWMQPHSAEWTTEVSTLIAINNKSWQTATAAPKHKNLDNYAKVEELLRTHLINQAEH